MRVLIADGDEAFLEDARRYLSHHGLEVKIATNGLQSVAVLRHDMPDVVVLQQEVLWGGSDGVRAVMQQDPAWSEIPVILTSDNDLQDDSGDTVSPPLAARLQKPYRLEQLLCQLQACTVSETLNPARAIARGVNPCS